MASITIRNLNEDIKERLRERAAQNNRSMEEEARLALADYVGQIPEMPNVTQIIRAKFGPKRGVAAKSPSRTSMREPSPFE